MVKIKMLQTRRGAEDGFCVKQFLKGEIYDVRDMMASDFISKKWAEVSGVIYYNMRWIKTGVIERKAMSPLTPYYIEKGIIELLEISHD